MNNIYHYGYTDSDKVQTFGYFITTYRKAVRIQDRLTSKYKNVFVRELAIPTITDAVEHDLIEKLTQKKLLVLLKGYK